MPHSNHVQLVDNAGWDARILVCRNDALVDTYLVVTRRYLVVVDTLINPATGARLLALARPYLTQGRSLLVVNTHADYDHCWGNQVFADLGTPIIGQREAPVRCTGVESLQQLQRLQAEEPDIFADVQLTPPNLLFDERLTIDGGDLTLELMATPGHTPDHISIYLPEIETLLAGDAAELPFPMAERVADLPHMRRSLERLAALNARTVLYCHGPVEAGPRLLQDNIAYFDRLEEACRVVLARGTPPDGLDDAGLIRWVGLPFGDAVPEGPAWAQVPESYRTAGHAAQIRQMLAWLQQR